MEPDRFIGLRALATTMTTPRMRRLQSAGLITLVAEWAAELTLSIYAWRAGGAAAVGTMALVLAAPTAPVAPFLGLLADRMSRRSLMLATNGIRAAALALVAALVAVEAPLAVVFAGAAAYAVVGPAYFQAHDAMLPSMAETPVQLSSSNAATAIVGDLGFLVGSLGGGALVSVTSVSTSLAVAAGLFAATLLMLLGIPSGKPTRRDADESVLRNLTAGFVEVARDRTLRATTVLAAALSFTSAATDVLVVIVAIGTFAGTGTTAGALSASWAIGAIVGGTAVLGTIMKGRIASGILRGAFAVAAAFAAAGHAPNLAAAFVLFAVVGAGCGAIGIAVDNLMQRFTPDHLFGRVSAVMSTLDVAMAALGGFLVGVISGRTSVGVAALVVGTVLPAGAFFSWLRLRGLDEQGPAPEAAYRLLKEDPVLQPLPLAAVERLARLAREIRPDEGSSVIREGEPGDCYYLLVEGNVTVCHAGGRRQLEAGAGFGELALLRDEPRSATVVAGADVLLLALDREDFLAAVRHHEYSRRAAEARVEAYPFRRS